MRCLVGSSRSAPGSTSLVPGQLVAVDGLIPCGRCWWCERHLTPLCASLASIGMHADGGLADFLSVPARGCIPVADHVASDTAALAEPIAVGVRALRRGRSTAGESVVVFGAGMVGIATVAAARAFGARSVTLVGNSSARRDLASALGADRVVDSAEDDLIGWLRDHHSGRGPDLVIEASGDPAAANQGDQRRHGGAAGPWSSGSRLHHPRWTCSPWLSLSTEVIGSLSHVWDEDFRAAVGLLERGAVHADQVVSARIPLEDTVSYGFERDDWKALPGAKVLVGLQP